MVSVSPRTPAVRNLILALSVVLLSAMHRPAPIEDAGPVGIAPDQAIGETRHVDESGGSIAHAIAAVVVRARRGHDDERAAAKRRLRDGQSGTYIGDILAERDSSLARWPDRGGRPLTVWIQPRSAVDDFNAVYVDRVHTAFLEWDALRLPVQFSFVPDSVHADVHVTWVDHFEQPISGRTRWARDDDWAITDANIILAVHHHEGELLDDDSMRAMAMHEIGHLIGLDHTSDSTSIMAPRVRVRELSVADRATARLLYSLPPGPFR